MESCVSGGGQNDQNLCNVSLVTILTWSKSENYIEPKHQRPKYNTEYKDTEREKERESDHLVCAYFLVTHLLLFWFVLIWILLVHHEYIHTQYRVHTLTHARSSRIKSKRPTSTLILIRSFELLCSACKLTQLCILKTRRLKRWVLCADGMRQCTMFLLLQRCLTWGISPAWAIATNVAVHFIRVHWRSSSLQSLFLSPKWVQLHCFSRLFRLVYSSESTS